MGIVQDTEQPEQSMKGGDNMGFKVKEARESVGMTQEELEQKSGVSRTIISGLETGTIKNTTTKTLMMIAEALGTTVENIFFAESVQ